MKGRKLIHLCALNSRGLAIVQALLLVTLSVMVITFGMQMVLSSKIGILAAMQNADMDKLASDLDSMLKTESSCRHAIGGPLNHSAVGTGPYPLAQTLTVALGSNGAYIPTPIKLYNQNQTSAFLDPTPGSGLNNFDQLMITSMTLQPVNVPGTGSPVIATNANGTIYFTQLTINATRSTGMGGIGSNLNVSNMTGPGGSTLQRNATYLSVLIDSSNRMLSCTSLTFLGTDVQPLPICPNGYALYSNGKQVRCQLTVCPVGKTALSPNQYWPNGDLKCQ